MSGKPNRTLLLFYFRFCRTNMLLEPCVSRCLNRKAQGVDHEASPAGGFPRRLQTSSAVQFARSHHTARYASTTRAENAAFNRRTVEANSHTTRRRGRAGQRTQGHSADGTARQRRQGLFFVSGFGSGGIYVPLTALFLFLAIFRARVTTLVKFRRFVAAGCSSVTSRVCWCTRHSVRVGGAPSW